MNPEVVPEGRPIDPEKMPALHRVIRPKKGNYRFKLTIPEKLVKYLTYPPGYEHEGEPVKEKTITETLDGKTVSYAMSKRVSILNALWDEQLELAEQRKKEAERNKTGNPENPPMDGSQDIDSMTSPEIDRFLTNLFRKKYIETASYRESLQNFTLQAEIRHHRTSLEQTVGIIGKVRNWADSPGHGNEEIRPFDPDYDEQITSMFREFLRDLSSAHIKAPEHEEDFLRSNHRLDIFRRYLAMVQEVATNNLSILGISDYGDERDNWQSHLEYTNEILELAKPQSKNHVASPQTGESAILPNAEASQATIGKSIDEYLETYYSKSRRKGILRSKGSTAYAAESRYLEHIKKYFGKNTLISTLDTKAATRFVSDIVNHSAWNPKTMLNYVSSFRNFCKWMVDVKEWFPKNPVRDFHINMLPPKTGLTEEEIRLKMPTEPQLQILFSCERYIGKSHKSVTHAPAKDADKMHE